MEKSLFPQAVIDLSTFITIIGFILTIGVLCQTRKIKSFFSSKVRLPEIDNELSICASKINNLLHDWDKNKNKIDAEYSKCLSLVENLISQSDGNTNLKAKRLVERMYKKNFLLQRSRISVDTQKFAWSLYSDLSGLNASISQTIKDSRWSGV